MRIVAIGSSTGGPQALDMLFRALPEKLPVPFIVLQHLPARFTASMAARMDAQMPQKIMEVEDGDLLNEGAVYIVPGDHDFFLESPEPRVRLIKSDALQAPSIDAGFSSVADFAGPDTIGVVLTGMGKDGLKGAESIKKAGGYVIAQNESSSAVYGMPREVHDAGLADEVLSVEQMPDLLMKLLK